MDKDMAQFTRELYKLEKLIPLITNVSVDGVPTPMLDHSKIQATALHPAVDAFQYNMECVHYLSVMPPTIAYLAQGMGDNSRTTVYPPTATTGSAEKGEVPGAESVHVVMKHWLGNIGMLFAYMPDFELKAWLGSLVTGTWTAFEVLARDLWEAALNAHPAGLADLTGRRNRIGKLSGEKRAKSEDQESDMSADKLPGDETTIRLHDIRELTHGDYDIRNRMGSLLIGRFKFTTLRGIREAYSVAFSEQEKRARTTRIDDALAAQSLDALNMVRNLIVHKAGIADAEYEARARNCPLAPQLRAGKAMSFDGEVCQALIVPVVSTGIELVKAIDTWLSLTNPAPAS